MEQSNSLELFITNHQWAAALLTFVLQVLFIFLRTANVAYIADRKLMLTIATGVGIGLAWMCTTAISVTAVMDMKPLPIIAHLLGGVVGTYWGFKVAGKKSSKD